MNTNKTRIAAAYKQLTGMRLKGRISSVESISIEDMAPALYAQLRTKGGTYTASCVYHRRATPQWVLRLVVPTDRETLDGWEQYEMDSYL
jgi:hypothetical protein